MKTTAFGIASFMITFLSILIVLNITTQSQMDTKMQRELSKNMDSALTNAMISKHYTISSEDELIADVLGSIIQNTSENVSLDASVKAVDLEKGILSLQLAETYKKMNGKDKTITLSKTVVLEAEDDMSDTYLIEFVTEDFNYKTYRIKSGETLVMPLEPNISGKTFASWTLNGVDVDVSTFIADKDYRFVARFN